jgi:hypothetical protein
MKTVTLAGGHVVRRFTTPAGAGVIEKVRVTTPFVGTHIVRIMPDGANTYYMDPVQAATLTDGVSTTPTDYYPLSAGGEVPFPVRVPALTGATATFDIAVSDLDGSGSYTLTVEAP